MYVQNLLKSLVKHDRRLGNILNDFDDHYNRESTRELFLSARRSIHETSKYLEIVDNLLDDVLSEEDVSKLI